MSKVITGRKRKTPRKKMKKAKENIKAAARYIATAPNRKVLAAIMSHTPNDLVKIISNAALNTLQGQVYINPQNLGALQKKRRVISLLADKNISLSNKRRVVQSGRGIFALLPILLSTALSAFGSRFFAGNNDDKSE